MLRRLLRLSALIAIVASAAPVFALNPIQIENSKPGTSDWILTKPHQYIEIEGYASATSINRGGSISFFVRNLVSTSYTLEVFRVGWYGGMDPTGTRGEGLRGNRAKPIRPVPTPHGNR